MSDIASDNQLRAMVDEQGKALLDYIALIAAGRTDIELEIPEGIDIMSDLAVALQYLAEDVGDRIRAQERFLDELEIKVQERTQELEATLTSLRRSQQQLVREEWNRYMRLQASNLDNPEWMEADNFEPAVLQAVEAKSPAFTPANGSTRSALTLPINYADELIGLLGFEGEDLENISDEDLAALEDIAEQVGLALENQRLFDQTQLALTETQELYRISSRLNAAESPEEIIDAIVGPLSGEEITLVRLWSITEDSELQNWMELVGSWSSDDDSLNRAPGFRIPVALFPTINSILRETREVVLISDVQNDPVTKNDPEFITVMTDLGMTSVAFLPLTLGSRLVGMLNFGWVDERTFDNADFDRYSAIAAQVGTALDSLRLLEETRIRANQLEMLTDIETDLSIASNENEILEAIATRLPGSRVALHYLFIDDAQNPIISRTVASYEDGQFLSPEYLNADIELASFPAVEIWLEHPNRLTSITNLFDDPRTSEQTRAFSKQMGYTSSTILPLRSGRLWQGVLTISWKEEHRLTSTEAFILDQLREPLGAIIASNRAKTAEAEARKQSEQLYAASRSLNQASNNLHSIIGVLSNLGQSIGMSQTILTLVQENQNGTPRGLEVVAYQNNSETMATNAIVGQRFGRASLEQISTFSDPFFIENLNDQSELTIASRRLIENFKATSLAILPLLAGDQRIGYVFLVSDQPTEFAQEDRQLLQSLTPQVAVAIQNSQLFNAAQKKAEREEILRQITEKIRNTTDVEGVMRTAVGEIGRLLNRKTFVYLKDASEDTGEFSR